MGDDVELEDFAILDTNAEARGGALAKAKANQANKFHEQQMLDAYKKGQEMSVNASEGSRMRLRNWHAGEMERLPEIVAQRRKDWRNLVGTKNAKSFTIFKQHMLKTFGNEIRAWRRCLDKDGMYCVSRNQLSLYCSVHDLNTQINFNALWSALDVDGDGVLRLEEVGAQPAAALANFRKWAR